MWEVIHYTAGAAVIAMVFCGVPLFEFFWTLLTERQKFKERWVAAVFMMLLMPLLVCGATVGIEIQKGLGFPLGTPIGILFSFLVLGLMARAEKKREAAAKR